MANDSEFQNIIASREVRYNYATVPDTLREGTYYWRVFANAGANTSQPSSERELVITKTLPLHVLAPSGNQRYALDASGLLFSWQDPNRGTFYRVEVAGSDSFETLLASKVVTGRQTSIEDLPESALFWRVSLLDENNVVLSTSDSASFNVYKQRRTPQIIVPADGTSIDLITLDQVRFEWKADTTVRYYSLRVFDASKGRSNPMVETVLSQNSYVITDIRRFREKQYIWEVCALERKGSQYLAISDTVRGSFRITLTKRVFIPEIQEPEIIYED